VLYGGDSASTYILEVALPWKAHVDAAYAQRAEAPWTTWIRPNSASPSSKPSETRRSRCGPAHAAGPVRKWSKFLHGSRPRSCCVTSMMSQFAPGSPKWIPWPQRCAHAACYSSTHRYHRLRPAPGDHASDRQIPDAKPFFEHRFSGIRTISRWKGDSYVLFENRYELGPPLVGSILLNRDDPDVVEVATMMGMVP
jgi:hypothetical protein